MTQISKDKKKSIHELGLRMERDHFRLRNFLVKLNSYTCEPKDYNCFLVSSTLKTDITNLMEIQTELIQKIRKVKVLTKVDERMIASCLRDYKQLELDFTTYLSITHNRYASG